MQELKILYDGISPCDLINVRGYLDEIAHRMLDGVRENKQCVFSVINNYNKQFIGIPIDKLSQMTWSHQMMLETLAQERGFSSWSDIDTQLSHDVRFETAIEYIICGEVTLLDDHLTAHPHLVLEQSPYAHRAYLLHYCANNGVEFHRQQVPHNLSEVIKTLLNHGADTQSLMSVYGGKFTSADLMITSCHPRDAGLDLKEIMDILKVKNEP